MTADIEIPERLLDTIYDAATDGDLWCVALKQIADLTNSQGGILFGQSTGRSTVYFDYNGGLSEECNQAYKARHVQNAWSLYMNDQPAGLVVASDTVLPLSELRRTAFYDEVLHPQDVAHNAMIALVKQRDFRAAFNLCRGARRGPFDQRELRFLARLTPHLRRSMQLGFRLDGYKALQRQEYRVLDQLSVGVILLDRATRIIFANTAARALSADAGALRLRDAKVTLSPPHSTRLENLIQAVLCGLPTATMSVPRSDDGRVLTILVSSVRGRDIARMADAHLRDAAVMLFLFDPANRYGIPVAWIMDAYGLTLAEAKVAVAACSHATIAETASHLHLSPNTVKTHLRRTFAKTGTSGQAGLAQLLASMALVRGHDLQP